MVYPNELDNIYLHHAKPQILQKENGCLFMNLWKILFWSGYISVFMWEQQFGWKVDVY